MQFFWVFKLYIVIVFVYILIICIFIDIHTVLSCKSCVQDEADGFAKHLKQLVHGFLLKSQLDRS